MIFLTLTWFVCNAFLVSASCFSTKDFIISFNSSFSARTSFNSLVLVRASASLFSGAFGFCSLLCNFFGLCFK